MKLFKREKPAPAAPAWPPEQYEPVIRSSICTGEQVACMRERETGKLHEAENRILRVSTCNIRTFLI